VAPPAIREWAGGATAFEGWLNGGVRELSRLGTAATFPERRS
jgi:hypothetical protein